MSFETIKQNALRQLKPPQRLDLAQWIEKEIVLPSSMAMPGRVRLYKYQKGIAQAISDPSIERVTLVKSIRVGFTTLITSAIASYIINDPSPIMVLLPTESDARSYMVSDIEPIFASSPLLQNVLEGDDDGGKRNTLLQRGFKGGHFLKILPAMAPHNLRQHNIRILFCDEVDGYEVTSEGSAVKLAIGRTMSYPNRKIVLGSTPRDKDTSTIMAAYAESDQRVFECPCPACGGFTELKWKHIVWPKDHPEEAKFKCPHCESLIDERYKAQMVENGDWRATRPEVKNHAGYRLNSLVSPLANARWGILAADWLVAQGSPHTLRVFVNQALAEAWEIQSALDRDKIASRGENFDINNLPWEIVSLTCGIDVQDDRLECVVLGWSKDVRDPVCFIIHHKVIPGHFTDPQTWMELDEFLLSRFSHPRGGTIGFDAVAVDGGDGQHWATVLDYCNSTDKRRYVFAIKGYWGTTRKHFTLSKEERVRWGVIGVDAVKGEVVGKLQRETGIRFSHSLSETFYKQLASEHQAVRTKNGMPVRYFKRIGNARAECLDAVVYGTAVKTLIWPRFPFAERIDRFKLHGTVAMAEAPSIAADEKPPAGLSEDREEEWYQQQIEGMLREDPSLRNDPEIAKMLEDIEDASDEQ